MTIRMHKTQQIKVVTFRSLVSCFTFLLSLLLQKVLFFPNLFIPEKSTNLMSIIVQLAHLFYILP